MFKWFKRKKDDERELKTETSEVYEQIRQKKDDKVSLCKRDYSNKKRQKFMNL
jgi:hypothetical protein